MDVQMGIVYKLLTDFYPKNQQIEFVCNILKSSMSVVNSNSACIVMPEKIIIAKLGSRTWDLEKILRRDVENCTIVELDYSVDEVLGLVIFDGDVDKTDINILLKLLSFSIEHISTEVYAKDIFIKSMGHEIRAPLNGIIGYSQLLMDMAVTEKQAEYLHYIYQCSLVLTQIINDVLDYNELSSGKSKVSNVCCKVSEIANNASVAVKTKMAEKRQTLAISISDNTPKHISIDKNKITQVVVNITTSLIKFLSEEHIIEVNFSCENGELVCQVKNQGEAIPNINDLFLPFFQVDTMKKLHTTFDLGFMISKKLCILMGGDIYGESGEGGNIFTIRVKYNDCQHIGKSMEFDGKNILVVHPGSSFKRAINERSVPDLSEETSPKDVFTLSINEYLFSWGVKVLSVQSVDDAVKAVSNFNFDVAIVNKNFAFDIKSRCLNIQLVVLEKSVSKYQLYEKLI